MGKRKTTAKKSQAALQSIHFDGTSADEWKTIIAEAIIDAEERKLLKEKEQKEAERKARLKALGYKDYSNKKAPQKQIFQIFNAILVLIKIPFLSRKHLKKNEITISILQVFPALFFMAIAGILFLASLAGLFLNATSLMAGGTFFLLGTVIRFILEIVLCFLLLVWARLSFIASIEIIETEDSNYIFGLFACITSIVSICIALFLSNS